MFYGVLAMFFEENKLSMSPADAAFQRKDWARAREAYLGQLRLDPKSIRAMLQLSYVESLDGHYVEAADWADKCGALFLPGDRTLAIELARRLRTFNNMPVLRKVANQLLSAAEDPVALAECARQLGGANDFEMAMRCAGSAFALAPADPQVCLIYGQLLAHHGDEAGAVGQFDKVLAKHPSLGAAWWMRSRLRRQTQQSNHIEPLIEVLRSGMLDASSAASVARALHKEFDDLGNYGAAWKALEIMCRAKRDLLDYDKEDGRRLVDALIDMPIHARSAAPKLCSTPIFIVGMHRSGTTLLEQLLDASPNVRALGELNDLPVALRYASNHYSKDAVDLVQVRRLSVSGAAQLEALGRRYHQGLAWRLDGQSHFTDKLPSNYLNVGFILRALPDAKVLHLSRDPRETCFSNLRELFSDVNPFSYDQGELAAHFIQYDRLMRYWHQAFPGAILDVDYAALLSDPAGTMRAVSKFCDLPYVEGMAKTTSSSRVIATASSVQVREGIQIRSAPKWLPYAEQLAPLIAELRGAGLLARYESADA